MSTPTPQVRDGMIHQAQQERLVRDTIIAQKVNGAHREGFKQRFPGQVEHILRLTAERLHNVLLKKPEDPADPATWTATPAEIRDLSQALQCLVAINKTFPVPEPVNEAT
jgi:hypothetical protein